MQNRKDIRWPYPRQIKFQDSFICWKEKKNLENAKISYKYQVFISALLKKKTKTLHSQTLNQHKNKRFQFSLFSWQSWWPPVTFPQKKSCSWEKSPLSHGEKASACCMRKKPCGLVDRLNTCECQSTLPSHKLQLLLVQAEYDFPHRGGEQSPSPCRIDEQLCMSNSVTFL